jgi:hypothetical protein
MRQTLFASIFIGLSLMSYSQTHIKEISHYVFPEFTLGVVLMKTGQIVPKTMNYNTITEEMVFLANGKKMAIAEEEMATVDTVFIKDKKFFVLNGKFVELICHSGFDLYAENRCRIKDPGKPSGYGGTSQTGAIDSYSSLLADGNIYDMELPAGFTTDPYSVYWLKRNGELNKILNMKQLMKLYEDKEDLFKSYVKEHDVKYKDRESLVQLIKYMETN